MKMRRTLAISIIVLLAFVGGCKQNADQTASSVESSKTQATAKAELTPEQLGELGAKIRKNPDRTAELLREHGLDEKSYEAEIRTVTENADASKRYAAAYKAAS